MTRILTAICLLLIASLSVIAQDDAEGCKDHPLLSRMNGFMIESCSKNYNEADFQTGPAEAQTFEGNLTTLRYASTESIENALPSEIQILRNYENAIVAKGGKKVYIGDDELGDGGKIGVFTLNANGVEHWVRVGDWYSPQGNGIGAFTVMVQELTPMTQEVTADVITAELVKNGKIALYINFETGKSTIKSESQAVIDQLAVALKEDPGFKVSIEGHTDNAGTPAANKTLSEQRAQAVLKALVAKGIDATRLNAKGWGQEKPIADNATEDGKAKNRRVEIVKL